MSLSYDVLAAVDLELSPVIQHLVCSSDADWRLRFLAARK